MWIHSNDMKTFASLPSSLVLTPGTSQLVDVNPADANLESNLDASYASYVQGNMESDVTKPRR